MKTNLLLKHTALLILFFVTIAKFTFSSKFNIESFDLQNILKENKKSIFGKAYFLLYRNIDNSQNYLLNNLKKLIFEITNTDLLIFNHQKTFKNKITLDYLKNNFLLSIKLREIDLICADYLFLCTYGQFKNEYSKKLIGYNLNINPIIQDTMTKVMGNLENIESNCLILTTGAFIDINFLPFLCFEVILIIKSIFVLKSYNNFYIIRD